MLTARALLRRWQNRDGAMDEPEPPSEVQPTGNPLPKLFAASLKMIVRDRRTMVFSLFVPLLFTVIFGLQDFGGKQHAKVTVVPAAGSVTAFQQRTIAGLRRDTAFRVTVTPDLGAAKKKLHDGKTDLVLALPAVPGSGVTAYYKPENTHNDFALGSIQRFVDGMNLRLAGVTSPPLPLTQRAIEAKDTNYYDFLLPGLIAWSVLNLSIIGMAIAVTRFREQQILKRILATPLGPGKFVLAQVGARVLLSIVQAAIVIFVAVNYFNAHVKGDPVWLFFYVALGSLVFLNIGFAIAGRSKTTDSAQALSQMITLPMVFLSGVFFPTSGLPPVLEQIVKLLPLTPLTTALRKISLDGDPVIRTYPQLALLLAWLVVSFFIARQSFSFSDETAGRRLRLAPRIGR
jgi:ABC-2 type transport system permease protein